MSGFVYVWFDRKHRRFYVGCHWGMPNDGYVCSSDWMRAAYRRRPTDFKRRIIATISTCREDMFIEERRWIGMIRDEQLGKRFYNLRKNAQPPSHSGLKRKEETRKKIRINTNKQWADPIGRQKFVDAAKARAATTKGKYHLSSNGKKVCSDPVVQAKMAKGRQASPEFAARQRAAAISRWGTDGLKTADRKQYQREYMRARRAAAS